MTGWKPFTLSTSWYLKHCKSTEQHNRGWHNSVWFLFSSGARALVSMAMQPRPLFMQNSFKLNNHRIIMDRIIHVCLLCPNLELLICDPDCRCRPPDPSLLCSLVIISPFLSLLPSLLLSSPSPAIAGLFLLVFFFTVTHFSNKQQITSTFIYFILCRHLYP